MGIACVVACMVGAALVLPNALWPDARPPARVSGGAERAAAEVCDVGPFARVASIGTTASPDELSVRCVYSVLGRPVMTGSIRCLNGRWTVETMGEGRTPGGCT